MGTKATRDYNHQDLYIHACIHPGFYMIGTFVMKEIIMQ